MVGSCIESINVPVTTRGMYEVRGITHGGRITEHDMMQLEMGEGQCVRKLSGSKDINMQHMR